MGPKHGEPTWDRGLGAGAHSCCPKKEAQSYLQPSLELIGLSLLPNPETSKEARSPTQVQPVTLTMAQQTPSLPNQGAGSWLGPRTGGGSQDKEQLRAQGNVMRGSACLPWFLLCPARSMLPSPIPPTACGSYLPLQPGHLGLDSASGL